MVDHAVLIDSFSQKSKELEGDLQAALVVLSEGKAPSDKESLRLTNSMTELREAYAEIKREALLIRPDIVTDQSVSVYKALFDEYEVKKLSNQIESLVITLTRFAAVVSESPEYQSALSPYQEEAEQTLRMLQSDEIDVESKLEVTCENQQVFLEAISVDNESLSSVEGETLLDALDAHYSRKVVRGILLGQYEEPINASDVPEAKEQGGAESETALHPSIEKEADAEDVHASETISSSANDLTVGLINSETQTIFVNSLNKVRKPSSVSAASFKKDLFNMPPMVRIVLPLISRFGAIDERRLVGIIKLCYENWEDENKEDVRRAIDSLVKKKHSCCVRNG